MQSSDNQELNPLFVRQMLHKLGHEAHAFFDALQSPAPVSVFLNPSRKGLSIFPESEKVPWSEGGRYLAERPGFIFDPLFHGGCYYVMESSSMCIEWVLRQVLTEKPVRALDMCAAPGGKSAVLVSSLPERSLLVANEVHKQRFQILQQNMDKWGMPNVIRCNLDPEQLPGTDTYDIILVDAPCSGEGLFRKDKDARDEWSPANVALCSARQRRILDAAVRLLRPGGFLIYSTCTYQDAENLDQVKWLGKEHGMISQRIHFDSAHGIVEMSSDDSHGYQFYPHRLQGEGLFVSLMEKKAEDVPPERRMSKPKNAFTEIRIPQACRKWLRDADDLHCYQFGDGRLFVLQSGMFVDSLTSWHAAFPGTEIGEFKGEDFIPAHALALSNLLHPDIPSLEADEETAIAFLRKDSIVLTPSQMGWHIITYCGVPLGWVKQTQAGLKNYLPTKYRILKAR